MLLYDPSPGLGYKINTSHESKILRGKGGYTTQGNTGDVNKLSQLQKGGKKKVREEYNRSSVPEALEPARQRFAVIWRREPAAQL